MFVDNFEISTAEIGEHLDEKMLVEKITLILKESSILQEIQKIQLLDQYDIEFISKLYECYSLSHKERKCLFEDQIDDKWVTFIQNKVKDVNPKIFHCGNESNSPNENQSPVTLEELIKNEEKSIQILREYLISHTLKDCSIMISFSLKSEKIKIGIVDLDPKLASKIPKYQKLDEEIVKYHQLTVKNLKK